MKTIAFAALIAATTPFAVKADTITLTSSMAGATLHTVDVDMSVYFTPNESTYDVVAIYAPRAVDATPQHLQMSLVDGDAVTFGLPGYDQAIYFFALTGKMLTVSGQSIAMKQAIN